MKENEYLNVLMKYRDIKVVKLITGMRRSGKTTLLHALESNLIENGIDKENILYLDLESFDAIKITNEKELYQYVKDHFHNHKLYLLFDEIENINHWEKAISSILLDMNTDIYITASTNITLSYTLEDFLKDRVLLITLYPLSYKEYDSLNKEKGKELNLNNYLTYGGMPYTTSLDIKNIPSYLTDIKDVILKNDVIKRNSIKDITLLDHLLEYMAKNVSTMTSANSISDIFNSYGISTSHDTIDNFLSMYENAYLLKQVPRYRIDKKEILKTQGKYYFMDLGIMNSLNQFQTINKDLALENLIYLELLHRGYTVYIGKNKDTEITFVAMKQNNIEYYQIVDKVDENTLQESMKKLLTIHDNYPKMILSKDKIMATVKEGIKIENIIDFLLER